MKLLERQKAFVRDVYREKPRVRLGIDSAPRGNGKTGLTAGLALAHLLGPESEPRGEVYSAAVDRTQSSKLFAEMEAIILAVPEFAARVNPKRHEKTFEVLDGDGAGSIYESLSSDARKGNGLAPSLWIYDELAQVQDFELLDNLETALGKRSRSLGLVISTQAESDDHRLSMMIDDGLTGADPTIVVHLLAAPADADPFDEGVVASVNPALGLYLNPEDVFGDARKARRMPAYEARYRNRRLNQRVTASTDDRLVTAAVWGQNSGPGTIDRARLKGRTAFAGLDLAGKKDLCACVVVFPSPEQPPTFDVLPLFWTPEDELKNRTAVERKRFEEWIRAGWIKAVPGPIVTPAVIARDLAALTAEFDLRCIKYDRWRIDYLIADLKDLGLELPLEPFGQGHSKAMAPAIEFLADCTLSSRLRHGSHPVLTASVAGAVVTTDKAGNPMIDKSKGRGPVRIDGAVALTMALGAAQQYEPPPPKRSLAGMLRAPVMVT